MPILGRLAELVLLMCSFASLCHFYQPVAVSLAGGLTWEALDPTQCRLSQLSPILVMEHHPPAPAPRLHTHTGASIGAPEDFIGSQSIKKGKEASWETTSAFYPEPSRNHGAELATL